MLKANVDEDILNNFAEIYAKHSKVEIAEMYKLNYEQTDQICEHLGIHIRGIQEANNLPSRQERMQKTNLERYGDTNVLGKNSSIFEKRNQTVKKRYGVDNVFQMKEVITKISDDAHYLKKFGLTRKQLHRKKYFQFWNSLTDDQKTAYRKVWSEAGIKGSQITCSKLGSKFCGCSALEKRVVSAFAKFGFNIQTQKCLTYFDEVLQRKRCFFYDIFLKDYNLIIEVNGDYWHANPSKYKENDLLSIPGDKECLAKDIWEHDRKKKEVALQAGFKVLYIWESDLQGLDDANFEDYLAKLLKV